MFELLKMIWKPIEKTLRFVGKVQSSILLTVFYVVILAPIAVIFQLIKSVQPKPRLTSYWTPRPELLETEETLLRQF